MAGYGPPRISIPTCMTKSVIRGFITARNPRRACSTISTRNLGNTVDFPAAFPGRMRIFHAIDSCDPTAGGVAEAVLRLSQSLCDLGVSSGILCGNDPQDAFLKSAQGEIHAFGPSRFGSFGYVPAMRSWLQEHEKKVDALVMHGLWQYPGVAVRAALRGTNTPYYVYPHGMLDPWFKETYPAKHFRKTIFYQ